MWGTSRGRVVVGVALLLLSALCGPGTTLAQATPASEVEALQREVETLKTDVQELKKELQSMRQALRQAFRRLAQQASPAPVRAQVRLAGNPMLGKPDAPITLIEFSDYQCPFCARFFRDTLPALTTEYIATGTLRYVFRDFPLDRIHAQARKAAEAAHCAGQQGKYWQMHDILFQNQKALQVEKLKEYARRLELDGAAFDTCLDQGTFSAEVNQDYEDGIAAGVRGTPGFFLGKTDADDTIEGTMISGAQPIAVFRQAIDTLLRSGEAEPAASQ